MKKNINQLIIIKIIIIKLIMVILSKYYKYHNICRIKMVIIFFLKVKYYLCQINDNFNRDILEEGNYDLIDITDNFNLSLIVTTAKNIYTGIPPIKRASTNANLINSTSIITINNNYLLAACLSDSLLTKININNGEFSTLINYNEITIEPILEIPITTCSLSFYNNYIFIGYSRIEYFESEINKTNILIKLELNDINNYEEGPNLNTEFPPKIFIFPNSTIKTNSFRQISCEPLNIKNDINNYRLVCIHEDLAFELENSQYRYTIFATTINESFDNFDVKMWHRRIFATNLEGGFKLYKIKNTEAKIVMKKIIYNININLENNTISIDPKEEAPNIYDANLNLFDYKSRILFDVENINFMNKNNIIYFRIYNLHSKIHFKLYDYIEENIIRILSYYDTINNDIIVIYQCPTNIKYFSLKYNETIFNINSISKTIELRTYEDKEYHMENLINNISNIGNLNIEGIHTNISGNISIKNYGINFYELLMNNNIFIPEKNYNIFKYDLAFIDHIENNYTRIYYLKNVNIFINACKAQDCISCWENINQCDEYPSENYALLKDNNRTAYPINKVLKGYLYNENSNLFEKCYPSCNFCYEISTDKTAHKCQSCANGYLHSYSIPGNCYKINNLQLNEEKIVNIDDNDDNESFILTSCLSNKIYSTGECIEICPNSTPFYFYEIDQESGEYIKKDAFNPPKYLFNKKCYEECPSDENIIADDINFICQCKFAFYIKNNNKTCFSTNNCPSDYNYKNPNTKECYLSLDDCFSKENRYFFNNNCYKDDCPENTVLLSSKNETIKNYYIDNLLLEDDIKDKICICDTTAKFWKKISSNNLQYFQECLDECPEGYISEPLTNQCIENNEITTLNLSYPEQYYKDPNSCPTIYENECYSNCPQDTCISPEDSLLMHCIPFQGNIKIFNHICFKNLDRLTNYIKDLSDNNTIITMKSGIVIRAYSSNSKYNTIVDEGIPYSIINLGECENKLREYYNIPENKEIYIFGINSPNKNKSFSTTTYNYEIYLENGTQLQNLTVCDGLKIIISSSIIDLDLVKFNEALYFSEFNYDIYDDNNKFYTDVCAPASIDGNDITLADRKKYYSTSNVSLCNETCKYLDIDFTTKRFICECIITSNYSDNNTNDEKKEEEDISYDIYFLSFINYKINICYKIFLQFRSFIYNFGFYIAVMTTISYFLNMIIFLKYGVVDLNNKIKENIPSKEKLKEHIKEKKKKKEKNKIILSNNIKDKKNNKKINIQKKNGSINFTSTCKINKIKEIKNYQLIDYKIDNPALASNPNNLLQNNILYSLRFTNDNEVDEKDFNTIPFTQALRIDKRNFFKMFISVLAHEISIINIFYYKNPFRHLSIILSIYIFELSLDLALNCLLYTDDVVSKKYHNNGSIEYITSLSLSFISNVFASLISSILGILSNYDEVMENIIKSCACATKRGYFLYIVKFKKYVFIKLVLFFFIEIIINIYLCYYMIIFCFVYQKTQGNIMINYIIGISESIAISLCLAIIISLIRYISIIKKLKSFYYASKYLYQNF